MREQNLKDDESRYCFEKKKGGKKEEVRQNVEEKDGEVGRERAPRGENGKASFIGFQSKEHLSKFLQMLCHRMYPPVVCFLLRNTIYSFFSHPFLLVFSFFFFLNDETIEWSK